MSEFTARQFEVLGLNLKRCYFTSASFSHERLAGERDFIEAVFPMNHPGTFTSQGCQNMREAFNQVSAPDTNYLPGRARRITQGSEQVERRVNAEFAANARNPCRGAMKERRKHETDSCFI
jgi:hypothetical protein